MFPGINGFEWNAGHVIFLGIFYLIVTIVLATVIRSLLRARAAFRRGKAEAIRWKADFHDLPLRDRRCRHELDGTVESRTCDNGLDCRTCAFHASVEKSGTRPAPPAGDLLGFPLPLDRLYHRGHTWVHMEQDGTLTVGLDELAARLAGKPERLSLPAAGKRLHLNGTAWHIGRNGSTVRVLAPLDGTVVATGGPDQGWYLKLRPDSAAPDTRHLLRGGEATRWMLRELERLQLLSTDGASAALADGGVPVADIGAALPKGEWDGICGEMLLQP